ncbi:hypothetical protein BV898_15419 [Hypsibius exemplaris]|uniref:F-box domain-containing protein n=1 Tax=Hypsibius exemplaris TaxID=2072580 RepID=A0A9X6NDZ3_HYPEX|nr:hypothetical protein BV898_15419 [Hypsibius exemplaris]
MIDVAPKPPSFMACFRRLLTLRQTVEASSLEIQCLRPLWTIAAEGPAGWRMQDFKDIPREVLVEILTCLDLPARIRLRRVCRFWHYMLQLPEVNCILQIDRRCFVQRFGLDQIHGWRWRRANESLYGPDSCEVPHLRGFLGAHVRDLIFDGQDDDGERPADVGDLGHPNGCVVGDLLQDHGLPWCVAWMIKRAPSIVNLHLKHIHFLFDHTAGTGADTLFRVLFQGFVHWDSSVKALRRHEPDKRTTFYPHEWEALTLTGCSFNYVMAKIVGRRLRRWPFWGFHWTTNMPKVRIVLDVTADIFAAMRAVTDPIFWPYPAGEQMMQWVEKYARLLHHAQPAAFDELLQGFSWGVNDVFFEDWHPRIVNYRLLEGDNLIRVARYIADYKILRGECLAYSGPHINWRSSSSMARTSGGV